MDKQNVINAYNGILFHKRTTSKDLYSYEGLRVARFSETVKFRGIGVGEMENYCLISMEFQFCNMKKCSGDGWQWCCTTKWIYLLPLNCIYLKIVKVVHFIIILKMRNIKKRLIFEQVDNLGIFPATLIKNTKKSCVWNSLESSVVRIHPSTAGVLGSIPGWGAKIPSCWVASRKKELGANKRQNKNKWEYI